MESKESVDFSVGKNVSDNTFNINNSHNIIEYIIIKVKESYI